MVSRCPQRGRELGCLEGVGEAGGWTGKSRKALYAHSRQLNFRWPTSPASAGLPLCALTASYRFE